MTTFTKEDREAAQKAMRDDCGGEVRLVPLSEERIMQLWEEALKANSRMVKGLIISFARKIEREGR